MRAQHDSIVRVAPAGRLRGLQRFVLLVVWVVVASAVSAAAGEPVADSTSTTQPDQQAAPPVVGADQGVFDSLAEASRLQKEADTHIDARQFREATEKTQRALDLRRERLGENHSDVAYSVNRLGTLAYFQGDYTRAETLIRDALRIREATLGPDDFAVAESLSDLATIFLVRGDYVRPEPLYQRALNIYEKAANGQTSRDDLQLLIAGVLNNSALMYDRRGDYERAESLYMRALAIRERTSGPDDPTVAQAAANLGAVYYQLARYAESMQVLRRALAIQEKHLSPNHSSLATSSFNLAAVYFAQGDYTNAETLFQRALTIDEQVLDPRHPRLAVRLVGLAEVLRMKGEYERAESLYKRALLIREQALGQGHPEVAQTLIAYSLLRHATGDNAAAVGLLTQGARLREETLSLVLTTGSEEAKRLYLGELVDETSIALSIHLGSAPTSTAAAELALTNIVQRKGRSLDAMAGHVATLRSRLDEKDRELFAQLSDVQGRLAKLVLSGISTDEQRTVVVNARNELGQLEQAISLRSAEYRAISRRVTLAEVQRALPRRAALLEFVSYRPFFVKNARAEAFGAPRYSVYVLSETGIASADLGEASMIEKEVQRFRAALSNPDSVDVRERARALHKLLMQPIEESLRDVRHLVISPDGALNLIPFAAMRGLDDRYLIERYTISYVTSGRDLMRLAEIGPARPRTGAPPVIVANPSFDGPSAQSGSAPGPQAATRAVDARVLDQLMQFEALPGTGEEAAALAKVLPNARVYTGAEATEVLLKQLRAPSILHIATHGFFLRQPLRRTSSSEGSAAVASAQGQATTREDSLLLSGLALAGANRRSSDDGQDGILTALEATGLDLWGTRMVVLSACETGIGDTRDGEGVYGLRRALVLAGSESQVMSLWQVSDEATRDLMIAYYRRLRAGEGRADAMRNVQLSLLRAQRQRAHPFFWASFIQSGDWRKVF